MIPKIGDKIKVITKLDGNKLCEIDSIDDKSIHFKNNSGYGLRTNLDRVRLLNKEWRGAKFEYTSFN